MVLKGISFCGVNIQNCGGSYTTIIPRAVTVYGNVCVVAGEGLGKCGGFVQWDGGEGRQIVGMSAGWEDRFY